jgi:2'-5' RNA ligase
MLSGMSAELNRNRILIRVLRGETFTMRLFIALDLDEHARTAIVAEQKRLASALREAGRSSIRWVRPDQMHLTLVFLGEINEARAEGVIAEIREEVPQAAFELVFEGIGVFPPRGAPTVLWAGTSSGAASAIALQSEMARRVARHGVPLESRRFQPHLTLGRWREARSADRQRVLAAASGRITALHVDHATLYQSRLSSAGPSYTALARANLSSG